jgi:hypothetical protein
LLKTIEKGYSIVLIDLIGSGSADSSKASVRPVQVSAR